MLFLSLNIRTSFIVVSSILSLALLTTGSVVSSSSTASSPRTRWAPCPDDAHFECASFPVPLDYAHPEVGDATLAIARLKATKLPRLGTIFTNPGGPGDSGVAFLIEQAGLLISTITQGQYDIVSWDPRGVSQSSPQISCGFTTLDSFNQFLGDTVLSVGIEARGNFTDQDDLDSFFSKVNETDAKIVETGQKCIESDGAFLKYMGTAAVARDMVSLSDFLEGPGKHVNYWGFSYGTVIGMYFVNMFPDRVGRVIIDGVVDTILWATQPTFEQAASALSDTEAVLEGFAETCAQSGPQNCSLAQNAATPASIVQSVKDLINTAYDVHKAGGSNITSFDIRAFLEEEFFTPTLWDAQLVPQLEFWAATLANATTGDAPTTLEPRRSSSGGSIPVHSLKTSNTPDPIQSIMSGLVISCVDSIDQENVTTQRLFEVLVSVTQQLAPTVGESAVESGLVFCHRFPVRAVERFTGPFNHNLSNPIIVIGNKADPRTPFPGAQRMAATLGNSARLVKHNGFGHTTLGENSDCTQSVIREYFLHGVLPENGTVCDTDQSLFPPNRTLISPSPLALRKL